MTTSCGRVTATYRKFGMRSILFSLFHSFKFSKNLFLFSLFFALHFTKFFFSFKILLFFNKKILSKENCLDSYALPETLLCCNKLKREAKIDNNKKIPFPRQTPSLTAKTIQPFSSSFFSPSFNFPSSRSSLFRGRCCVWVAVKMSGPNKTVVKERKVLILFCFCVFPFFYMRRKNNCVEIEAWETKIKTL